VGVATRQSCPSCHLRLSILRWVSWFGSRPHAGRSAGGAAGGAFRSPGSQETSRYPAQAGGGADGPGATSAWICMACAASGKSMPMETDRIFRVRTSRRPGRVRCHGRGQARVATAGRRVVCAQAGLVAVDGEDHWAPRRARWCGRADSPTHRRPRPHRVGRRL